MFNSKTILVATCFMCALWQAIGNPEANANYMQYLLKAIPQPKVDGCMEESGLAEEDLQKKAGNKEELNDKEICLLKCLVSASGTFNADGTVNLDKVRTIVLPKYQTPELMSCFENIGAIVTCEDMKKVVNCFPRSEQK